MGVWCDCYGNIYRDHPEKDHKWLVSQCYISWQILYSLCDMGLLLLPPLNQLNLLRFRVIDSPPIIQGLHLDPKKNTKHTSVPLHNLQILNVTIYNHYWTRPAARIHSGSITFGNIDWGCTHENSVCSLFVVTRSSEHTVTSIVLKWIHIIGKEGKQVKPHITVVWWPPKIVGDLTL